MTGANLYQVDGAWITSSKFFCAEPGAGALALPGSCAVQIKGCSINGNLNTQSPQAFSGVYIGSTPGWSANANCVDDCDFNNVTAGIYLDAGVYNTSCSGLRVFSPNMQTLISGTQNFDEFSITPVFDVSGNSTNVINYLSTVDAGNRKSGRFLYSRT